MILETSNKPAPRGALSLAAAFALAAVLVGPTWAPAQQPLAQESDEASAASPNQREESQLQERELVETRMRPLRRSLALERELIATPAGLRDRKPDPEARAAKRNGAYP